MKSWQRTISTKQATLPPILQEDTVSNMAVGNAGWTVPWAMWVDQHNKCWLHPEYTIHATPGGTVQMRVEFRDDGYHVWLVEGQRYSPSAEPGYCSPESTVYIPVAELHEEQR